MVLSLCVIAALAPAAEQPRAQPAPRANVLLITIDALRADRVNERLTPALTAIAARGIRFDRAYTHAPLTLPAHASILSGLLPPSHGVRNNGFRMDDGVTTLAELLAGAGYRTAAFVGSSALDARFGLSQGFHLYDDRDDLPQGGASHAFRQSTRPAAAVAEAAAAWIGAQREPWFVWAHFRDPHAPYAVYEQGVAAADTAAAQLLVSALRDALSRTLLVVTADHGESLGQHGERTHGVFAYEGVMRVPLTVAGPGVPPGVVSEPVSHVDIAPTILALLGVEPRAFDGRSIAPAFRGEPLDERPIYFEALDAALMRGGAPLTGVIAGRYKYIDLPLPELYDVIADPVERQNLAGTGSAVVTRLRDATIALRTRGGQTDAATTLAEPEARARLRSLGYVGSASWRLGATRPEDDPKRLLPLHMAYESAIETAGSDPDAAIARLRSIVEQRPDFAAAIDALGALLLARGRSREAVALLAEARAGGLRHRALTERLAAALLATKDASGAIALLAPTVESDGAAVNARFLLARAYSTIGNTRAAIGQLEAALTLDPTFSAARDLLMRLQKR